jgi:hypothetical protein
MLGLSVSAQAEIDLTPTLSTRELEGCKFRQLEFQDGKTRVTYEPPAGWDYLPAGANGLILHPKDEVEADAKIEIASIAGKPGFDEARMKALKAGMLSMLPKDSREVEIEEPKMNGILINGHPTCELVVTFVLFAQTFQNSILYVDLGQSEIHFKLSCLKSDFGALHKAFAQSWYTWQWL